MAPGRGSAGGDAAGYLHQVDGGRLAHDHHRPRSEPHSREETMNLVSFSLVLTGVLLNAAAQLLLKAGVKDVGVIQLTPATIFNAGLKLALEPHILGGLTCYVISVVVWILALSRVQVSIAYPMLSLGYVVTAVIAWGFMGETVNAMRMSGIAVIIVGVFLVARS